MDSYLLHLDPHKACVDSGIPAVLAPRLAAEECVKQARKERISTLSEITQDTPADAIQGLALSNAKTLAHLKEILSDRGDLDSTLKQIKELMDGL